MVWSTNRNGDYEIYKMRADGTDQVRLTYDEASDYHPVWSKDGQWIYYCRIDASEKEDIYRMRPDGTEAQLVLADASPFFDVSYDSSKIVYIPSGPDSLTIRLYDIESGTSQEIIPAVAPEYANKVLAYPTISPDGQWLAFASDYPDILAVQLSTLDGTTRFFYEYGCQPQYRPDGELIVWITNVVHDVYVGQVDGGNTWLFENSIPGRPHCYFPRWSNDGEYIIFGASPFFDWESDYDIYIKPFEGGEAVRLTSNPASDTWPDLYIASHTLSLSAGAGGTTEPEPGTYEFGEGREISITALPDEGYAFSHWSGDASGSANPLTLEMDMNKSITANFVQKNMPFLELDPSSLSFSLTQGEIKTQVLKLRNGGDGSMDWEISSNATWLSANPQSGESAGEWDNTEVSVDASQLDAGAYSGSLTISSSDAENSPLTLQVNLEVKASLPVIQLDRDSLAFKASIQQGNPPDQTFQIRNSEGGSLDYLISSDSSWLTVSPDQGISDGEWDTITVSANISGLGEQDYSGTLTIASASATNSPQTVQVSLEVKASLPVIQLDRDSLVFKASAGQDNPPDQTFQIRNSEVGSLDYSISSDSSWLMVSPDQGISDGEWDTITVSANISGLVAQDYSGTLTIASTNAANSPQIVQVSLEVKAAPPVIQLNRTSLAFTSSSGQGNPPDQTFQIRNSGGGSLDYTISSDSSWLTVSPDQGVSDGEWDTITVSADISGLAAQDYSGTLTIASANATNSPKEISVSLSSDVFPPAIELDRESLSFTAFYGEGNPASQAFQVRNSGGRSLTYSASSDSAWLGIFPNQGVSDGEWDTVNITVNISGLEPGDYSGKVSIASSSAANTPQSITVNLKVNLPPYPFQPVDLRLERIGHLGLFVKRYINQLTWKNHPRNSGNYTVTQYRIYRKKRDQADGYFVSIAEVSADGILIYADEFATQEERDLYTYGVTAVDDLGRESKRTKVSSSPG